MLSISIEELKSLLGQAFDYGCCSYKDLKFEFVDRIIESYVGSKPAVSHCAYEKCDCKYGQSSLLTVSSSAVPAEIGISVSPNVISNYYYYTDGTGVALRDPDSDDEINL